MNKIEELEKQLKEEMSKIQVDLKEKYKWIVGKYAKYNDSFITRIDDIHHIIGEQTIVFLAVNKNGDEVILNNAPARQGEIWTDERSAHDEEYFSVEDHNSAIVLPRGTIYKLAGRHLTWEDDPISLKSFIEEHPHIDIELCKKEFFLLDEELESFKEFLNDSTKNIYHSIDGVKIVKSENGGTLRSRQNTSSSKNFIKLQI